MKIPRVMSTQHPDNVQIPFFAESQDMSGDDESAACYSIGLPPEVLGLNTLSDDDLKGMKDLHVNFPFDQQTAVSYFNEEALTILPDEVKTSLRLDWGPYEVDQAHKAVTSRIIRAVKNEESANLQGMLIEAARIRKFFG